MKGKIMKKFHYILEKIKEAKFLTDPFNFLYIEDFLSEEDFVNIIEHEQIKFPSFNKIEQLLEHLKAKDYKQVKFPGCTTSIDEYLDWYYKKSKITLPHTKGLTEGFGLVFRLNKSKNTRMADLIQFLNSPIFVDTLMKKFSKQGKTRVETAIQKYLTGYEISPHPDIRSKCLTYMLNINTIENKEIDIYTNFMKFKKEYEEIYNFWEEKPEYERSWVPWEWCENVFQQRKNNSITIFSPNNRTLHSVKLSYDCLQQQRTQIYGNLWYNNKNLIETSIQDLEKIAKSRQTVEKE